MKPQLRPQITQCEGKRSYPTWSLARDGRGPSERLDIYRCPHCGQFHLGNKPKGQGRPKPPPPAIVVSARDGIEAQHAINDIYPGDPYPVADQLKRGLDQLRAAASRGPVSSREIFTMTDPLMDILFRVQARK